MSSRGKLSVPPSPTSRDSFFLYSLDSIRCPKKFLSSDPWHGLGWFCHDYRGLLHCQPGCFPGVRQTRGTDHRHQRSSGNENGKLPPNRYSDQQVACDSGDAIQIFQCIEPKKGPRKRGCASYDHHKRNKKQELSVREGSTALTIQYSPGSDLMEGKVGGGGGSQEGKIFLFLFPSCETLRISSSMPP